MKCIPAGNDFGLIISIFIYLEMTGAALYTFLYMPNILNMVSRNIILYIGMVSLAVSICLFHYFIPVSSFNINERTIYEVGMDYK